ncbi:hypothetical protein [Cyclobacterium sp. SYSU L10401]|uniref:hypothetical protein n=1 Tax=Cyclobacterium sp. SYSU L10401 TaxID=2678657 RepID=UPI0013D0D40D|nr:hypothetical protein [Cyclobacterium sp. SYSU L10401]
MDLTLNAYSKVDFKNYVAKSVIPFSYSFQKFIYLGKHTGLEEDENELTLHAMRLSESSLKEDWENEDDTHWDSFLE